MLNVLKRCNMKIYGNHNLIKTLEEMTEKDRTAHTVLFYGENGTGKKTIAEYYIYLLMCQNKINGKPCFNCKACHNISDDIHPDVITAEKSGKLGGYSVDTVKKICSDVFIRPNNSDKKVYIFKDCNNMDERSQNTLLKIIEEPPEYAYFIFTAESKSKFLPTVLSRCISFGVSPCTDEECKTALSEHGLNESQIKTAVECFHGNIGMCLDFTENENLKELVNTVRLATDSLISKDEYSFACSLNKVAKERENIKTVLTMLDRIIGDSVIMNYDKNIHLSGCYPEGAEKLSGILTLNSGNTIHEIIEKCWKAVSANVNTALSLSAMCGEIFEII